MKIIILYLQEIQHQFLQKFQYKDHNIIYENNKEYMSRSAIEWLIVIKINLEDSCNASSSLTCLCSVRSDLLPNLDIKEEEEEVMKEWQVRLYQQEQHLLLVIFQLMLSNILESIKLK